MLEIQVNNTPVDLPEDIQLSLTIENPFLAKESIPVPYSLTFELPPTPKNLKIFGHPDRLNSITNRAKKYDCDISFQSVSISTGSLYLDGYQTTIRVRFLGAGINDLKHPLYKNDLGRQTFPGAYNEVNYDSSVNFAYFYKQWATDRQGFQSDYTFTPISIKNENQPFSIFTTMDGTPIPNLKGVPKVFQEKIRQHFEDASQLKKPALSTNREYINSWNYATENFIRANDPDQVIGKYHSPMFPLFRVGWLIDQILGDQLTNNIFNDQNFHGHKLFLPTFYFPTWKETEMSDFFPNTLGQLHNPPMVSNPRPEAHKPYPAQPYVELADYLPNVATSTFIKEMIKLYGITIVSIQGKLHMKMNDDIVAASVGADWSPKVLDIYDISHVPGKEMKFKYSSSIENETSEEATEVANLYQMGITPYTLNDQNTYNELFYIANTRQYFTKTVNQQTLKVLGHGTFNERIMNYEPIRDGFRSDPETDSDYEILESEVIPLIDSIGTDFNDLKNRITSEDRFGYVVPQVELENRTERPDTLHLTLSQGYDITLPVGESAPSKPYYRFGSFPLGESEDNLAWRFETSAISSNREKGLIHRFHTGVAEWTAKDKLQLSATILLDILDLHNLDITKKVHIDGRNFFTEKINITITRDHIQPAEVDFIEA